MHDIAFIRQNPAEFDAGLKKRGAEPAATRIIALDTRRREAQTALQLAQSRRNDASKLIGQAMAKGDKDGAEALKTEVAAIKERMLQLENLARVLDAEFQKILVSLPNLPAEDVPAGKDEGDNVELMRWGNPREFDFAAKEHADLGPPLGLDFETGAAIAGARFTFLRGNMARLHRALGQFMLDHQTRERGYTECNPPLLVRDEAVFGTGQLPKFEPDLFAVLEQVDAYEMSSFANDYLSEKEERLQEVGSELSDHRRQSALRAAISVVADHQKANRRWLIPTAEVSLTNSVREQILDEAQLPMRMTALTPCFRSEAGSAGRDTRGFIRQHQFEKVELVSIVRPEDSEAEHERMTQAAEAILQALELPYRKLLLCAGDMGAGARKTYDLEVWLPGQGAYREISSCSNVGDWQARRMDARYRPANDAGGGEKKTRFVHTLNGSGLAVGRTLVAVLENYQQADGTVLVPDVLAPYMGGVERLEALQ